MFPHATYICATPEGEYWESLPRDARTAPLVASVVPVVEAGPAVLVDHDDALNDEGWREPTPGIRRIMSVCICRLTGHRP